MATPPKEGVACSCQRSRDGAATIRRATGERRSAQATRAVTGRATTATTAITLARLTKRC
jgi:hypothetical protein